MATANMNLILPVVSITLGPEWANELNAALEVIDTHDHSSNKGIKVKPSGLDISDDLDFQENSATFLKKSSYVSQSLALTGSPNGNSLYSVLGNLYYTNGSGVAVQITTGGAIVSSPAATNNFQYNAISADLVIAPSDTFVQLGINTSVPRTITLPSASAVTSGRIYALKDASGLSETNPITLNAAGVDTIDGASAVSIESNWSNTFIIGNGVDGWLII